MQQSYTSNYTKTNNSPYLSLHKLIEAENPAREEFTSGQASATTPMKHQIKAPLEAIYLHDSSEFNGQLYRNCVKMPCAFFR